MLFIGRHEDASPRFTGVMPIIEVHMLEGRTLDQKRDLARELTDTFVRVCGGDATNVRVLLDELPRANWAVAGELFSDRPPDR